MVLHRPVEPAAVIGEVGSGTGLAVAKYRPKMAAQLEEGDWAQQAADGAAEEAGQSIENGMFPLEAESEAKKNHMFLTSEEDVPHLGENPNALPDPASLGTTPRAIQRKKRPSK
jgi:hypothetical protein